MIAVIILGEVFAYAYNPHRFDADCEWTTDEVAYEVYSSGSDVYDVLLLDDSRPLMDAFIYVDEKHTIFNAYIGPAIGYVEVDSQYYAEQIQIYASIRGFTSMTIGGSEELASYISSTSPSPYGHAVISASFSLPATVYAGNADDPLLNWISDGGSLYWTASEIGASYWDADGLHHVSDGQLLFLGSQCQNLVLDYGEATLDGHGFRDALNLKTSQPMFGINTALAGSCLPLSYVTDGVSAITMLAHGEGNICMMGGKPDIDQYDDFGQILASGIDHDTVLSYHDEGRVVRGTTTDTISVSSSEQTLFVYIGGIYTVYGRLFIQ